MARSPRGLPLSLAQEGSIAKTNLRAKLGFNFKAVDEMLCKELAKLTKAGASQLNNEKFIDGLREMQTAGGKTLSAVYRYFGHPVSNFRKLN
jgi:hypothetical protein